MQFSFFGSRPGSFHVRQVSGFRAAFHFIVYSHVPNSTRSYTGRWPFEEGTNREGTLQRNREPFNMSLMFSSDPREVHGYPYHYCKHMG